MRALIRGEGETIIQGMKIAGINWDTGAPLTNDSWAGGPYVLVENYDPAMCEVVSPEQFIKKAEIENLAPETVTIDGVTYTRTP